MTPEQYERVNRLFLAASKRTPAERGSYLDAECDGDAELRAEVERMLAADGATQTDFLEPPAEFERPIPAKLSIEGYEIVRELHRGGQGIVYQAIQRSTKRKVAVKVLLEGPFASKAARRRFEREIELVGQLKHPNIIAVFHSGETRDGHAFCVMDYIRGKTLTEYVRDKKLTLEETLKLFQTVCEAVNYAHQKGVIHRDLKPSNIIVDSDGVPKVLDFGLARQLTSPEVSLVSMTGQVVGTLPYLSPEQARGNPDEIDTRTDVYALGVMLYELLTGHYPYPVVGQMADVLRHITESEPTPPSKVWKSDSGVTHRSSRRIKPGQCPIDAEFQTVIYKALSKERGRRYQSALDLSDDIGRYLADEPIEAKRDSALYVLKKNLRRYKVPVVTGSFVVLVLLAFGIVTAFLARNERLARTDLETAVISERRATRTALEAKHEADRLREQADAHADELRRATYAQAINLAHKHVLAGSIKRAEGLLNSTNPLARGFEWYLLENQLDQSWKTLSVGFGRIVSFAVSADERHLNALTADGRLFEFTISDELKGDEQPRVKLKLSLESDPTNLRLALSPTGDRVAVFESSEPAAILRVIDTQNGSEIKRISLSANHRRRTCDALAFSSDSQFLINVPESCCAELHSLIDGTSPAPTSDFGFRSHALVAAFSEDGRYLAIADSEEVMLFSVHASNWYEHTSLAFRTRNSTSDVITSLALNRTGSRVAAGTLRGRLHIWHVPEARGIDISGHSTAVNCLAFVDNDSGVLSGGEDTFLRTWQVETGGLLSSFHGHRHGIVAASAYGGNQVVSIDSSGEIKFWRREAREAAALGERYSDSESEVDDLSFGADGEIFATVHSNRYVYLRSMASGDSVLRCEFCDCPLPPPPGDEGDRSACSEVHLDEFGTDLRNPEAPGGRGWKAVQADGSGGRRIASANLGTGIVAYWNGMNLGLFDLHERERKGRRRSDHDGGTLRVVVSPNGELVATSGMDSRVKVWRIADLELLHEFEFPRGSYPRACFGPYDDQLACAAGEIVELRELSSGQLIWRTSVGRAFVSCVSFSLDGRTVICGCTNGAISILNHDRGHELRRIDFGGAVVQCVASSPDGGRIAAGGEGRVAIYDAATGLELLNLKPNRGYVWDLEFSPNGRYLGAGQERGWSIWDAGASSIAGSQVSAQ